MLLLMPLLDSLFLDVQCFLLPQSALYLAKGIVWSQFTPGACIQFGSHVPLCSQGRHLCFGRRVPWKDVISTNNTLLEQAERDLMSSHIHPTADHVPAIYKPWGLLHPSELIISLKNYHGGEEKMVFCSHTRGGLCGQDGAGRKMGARWHLTASCSSQLYFPVGTSYGQSVLHVCFLFSFGIPQIPVAPVEALLGFLLEAGAASGVLQDGLNGCCPLSSRLCCGVPVSPVQSWHHFPALLCWPWEESYPCQVCE